MSTTPTVPYRLEFAVEVPGTPEQVWDAIATAKGLTAWFLPTELEEREGGRFHFSMGEDMGSDGVITGWEPERRLEYQEDWAALMGKSPDELSPMTSEFIIEAQSGGTCVVRVTTSGFGIGADWEQEWWDDMGTQWIPQFDTLRLYLAHFAGQEAVTLDLMANHRAESDAVWAAVRDTAGLTAEGASVAVNGVTGTVASARGKRVLVLLTGPVEGVLAFYAFGYVPGEAIAGLRGSLFGAGAADYAATHEASWQSWLEGLAPGA